ncbi:hypothetical protein [Fischerella sp. JS2]|uniref:hypothetical protein n=1 Tax=Fischerella sp. JS2 TaxID=2597771 RepID=UPI0028E80F8D|nr:hypothetical protein [Fischerella sp. JS2]
MLKKSEQQSNTQVRLFSFARFRVLLPIILLIYTPVVILFVILKLQNKVPVEYLTRDPLAVAKAPFYWGAISNFGILIWCGAVVISLFSFKILQNVKICSEFSHFFLFSGVITSILLLDDLFLLHEEVFPYYLNISEKLVFLGYGILISFYLVRFRKTILKTEFIFLVLAFGFFGLSVFLDLLPVTDWLGNENEYLLEDGAKLLGMISWLAYFGRTCAEQIQRVLLLENSRLNK